MTSFQLPPTIFPENAITRAERSYQQHAAKKLPPLRAWISRTIMWLVITVSLIHFGGLFIASLLQRDPTPIVRSLGALSVLLIVFTVYYHFYLMFQTIALTANSITREKEAQTWELVVLTGINARQIVRGKWWATVQRQFSRYLLLGVMRAGATAAIGISVTASFYNASSSNNGTLQLPHAMTILISSCFGILFTIANLGFSAACGVMGSAVSRRSSIAILRGFVLQIVITVVPALFLSVIFLPYLSTSQPTFIDSALQAIIWGIASAVDNGFNLLSFPLYVSFESYAIRPHAAIVPVTFDWIAAAILALILYGLLIWFALWRAERRAVRALASEYQQDDHVDTSATYEDQA
ncbi:MAG: hypothetical protein H0X30_11470 [Anaerolineae bacterium]|nr:hypothetical protein [Anaerolineae bacterium]